MRNIARPRRDCAGSGRRAVCWATAEPGPRQGERSRGRSAMSWLNDFQFGAISRIVFGVGASREAGQLARELNGRAALVMTDAGLYKLGLTGTIEASLREAGVRVE